MRNVNADAVSYVMVMLLSRLEKVSPGLTADMLAGARADRAAASSDDAHIDRVFDAAIELLARVESNAS